jgi:hypothetical protein
VQQQQAGQRSKAAHSLFSSSTSSLRWHPVSLHAMLNCTGNLRSALGDSCGEWKRRIAVVAAHLHDAPVRLFVLHNAPGPVDTHRKEGLPEQRARHKGSVRAHERGGSREARSKARADVRETLRSCRDASLPLLHDA